jgi:hypothetical protein
LPVGSKTADNDQAAKSYRLLARKGFRDFIYAYVGYNLSGESSIAGEDGPGYSQGCPASALVRQN